MLDNVSFSYLLTRLKRAPDSPAGLSLKAVFVGGKLPGIAARETGIPMVRFSPVYDEAVKIVKAMTLTEADGFTADELPLANRALSVARAKESLYTPSQNEYVALDHIHNRGGVILKSMNGTVDELPTVALGTLWTLESNGAVSAVNTGGPVFQWTLTDLGRKLRQERFK